MKILARLFVALVLMSVAVSAQGPTPPASANASLSSTASAVLNVSGYASLSVQLSGTWTATVQFEASDDGANYQALNMTPTNDTATATSATGNGVWVGSVGGLRYARVRVSAYTSGTVVVTMQSALAGGGSGGGGGGGAASSVTINDPGTPAQKAAVNASGQLSITCANCSGSGASAVDNSAYVAGTTSGAPAMGFFHSTIDTVTDGRTATLAMDAKRSLFTVLRDAAGNARGVNVTAGNALTVDGSGVTQPVSGTFWQATQPVSGTFWQATQPISAAALPLPTGAATAAKQPALGTAGSASTDVITVQGIASMTKLLVTPDSVALPANQSVNVNQLAGTTTDTNSGSKSAGTLRVVLATDQPALTNALKVDGSAVTQPVSGTVTANLGTIAGVSTAAKQPALGTAGSASSDVLTVQGIASMTALKVDGSAVTQPVSLSGNQAVNVAQINGVTPLMGAGNTGTGSPRVTIATDQAVVAGFGVGATGSAIPANANYVGGLASGATGGTLAGATACDSGKVVSITSATTTLMITGVASRQVHICAMHVVTAIANNIALIEGTGATCGTGTAGMAGGTTAANGWNFGANSGIALGAGFGDIMTTATAGDSVCIITSAAGPVAGFIKYAIY